MAVVSSDLAPLASPNHGPELRSSLRGNKAEATFSFSAHGCLPKLELSIPFAVES